VHELSAHACSSIRAIDWGAWSSPVETAMNDTIPHDTSGAAASANTVRGRSGSTVGPSGSHYIIGPLQKASGPRKKEKTAMSHFWDTHHRTIPAMKYRPAVYEAVHAHSCSLCLHAKDFTFRYADNGRGREDGRRSQSLAFPPLDVIVRWAVTVWYC